jgi:hypothetical protein
MLQKAIMSIEVNYNQINQTKPTLAPHKVPYQRLMGSDLRRMSNVVQIR